MSVFNFTETNELRQYANDPVPFARMSVFHAGSDNLAPLFQDANLTYALANPVKADEQGRFHICHMVAGQYRVVIEDKMGAILLDQDDVAVSGSAVSAIARAFPTVDDLVSDRRLAYVPRRGAETVKEGDLILVQALDFKYRVAPNDAVDHHLETAGAVKLYVQAANGCFPLAAFGADPTGAADCRESLSKALDAIRQRSLAGAHYLEGADNAAMPQFRIDLGTGIYRLDGVVAYADIGSVEIVGRDAVLKGAFADFLIRLTGRCTDLVFRNIVFESTEVGCVDIDADNISSARVQFIDCRFVTDPDQHETGIGVRYTNQSSQLSFEGCFFNRIKHPAQVRNCDFVTFYNCWFGFPTFAAYESISGYILAEKGFLDIDRCLFAGGPSWFEGKETKGASAIPAYSEVSFVQMGRPAVSVVGSAFAWTESTSGTGEYYLQLAGGGAPTALFPLDPQGARKTPASVMEEQEWLVRVASGALAAGEWSFGDKDGLGFDTVYVKLGDGTDPSSKPDGYLRISQEPPFEDNTRVTIRNTRIGFENGAGPLVSWHSPRPEDIGATLRGGIVIENIQTAPREEKGLAADGATPTSALLRLYDMPPQIRINGVWSSLGNLAIIEPGSTTSLSALRKRSGVAVDVRTDLASQSGPLASMVYDCKSVSAGRVHMTATGAGPDATENARWMEIFGVFDYVFKSDFTGDNSTGSTPLATIETFFEDFSDDRRASVFEVFGGVRATIASGHMVDHPIHGFISVARDQSNTDTVSVRFKSTLDHSGIDPEAVVTAKFDVDGTRLADVPASSAPSAKLVVEVSHGGNPGVANIRCAGLMVKPLTADLVRMRGLRVMQDYI